jgi:DNA primase catalytic core
LARISDIELERLKREVSLERLAEAKGVKLERRGADTLVGLCPFHEEKTASFTVSPKKNVFVCFGCGAKGSVIDFVMKSEGISFRHAVEVLRAGAQLRPEVAVKMSAVRRLPAPVDASADDKALLHQVVQYYHQTLNSTLEAQAYLRKRGLDSAELIEHFKLGFANRTLGLRLPGSQWKAGGELRGRLQRLGVIRESGHEHLNGSLVVPLFDEHGDIAGMYGRKVGEQLRAGTPLHLYLPGPHRVAFNSAALKGHATAIVCEALLDALSFWKAGFRNVTSAYGVEGFTPHHLEALKAHGVKNVLIAYDRDDAGDRAAAELARRLFAEGLACWRVLFPRGMDANAYACSVKPPQSLAFVLRQAQWLGPDAGARPPPPMPERAARPPSVALAAEPPSAAEPPLPLNAPAPSSVVAQSTSSDDESTPTAIAPATGVTVPSISTAPEASSSSDAGDEHVFHFGPRRYRVRGLGKDSTPAALKLNILAGTGDAFHVDTFDLYQAKARAHFIAAAAAELKLEPDVVKHDVAQLLLKVEALQEAAMKAAAAPKVPTLTEGERDAALELLRSPNLLERVLHDFEKCGVVGEETNKLVGYLAAVSRKLEEPLAVLIQSSSAAGKSSLMEAVLAFVPDEDKVKFSAMTGQSLFYMGDLELKHKVLAVVEEEGAARAAYALKLLQSEGELTIASTGKNPSTGRLETHEYHVEGPTQLFLTTTASELDEELLNRCLVLSVDEERAQTKAIHQLQREKQTLEGLLSRRARDETLKVHQNAQRLLCPLLVANPFARSLTFLDDRTRTRRDFPKYLTLIRAIALLHQYQRPVKTASAGGAELDYIEVTADDVAVANRLAASVLGRSLDELPPQTRRLLSQLEQYVTRESQTKAVKRADFRFTRRELREALKLGDTQLKVHLARLVELELLATWRLPRGFAYELRVDAASAAPMLSGLADAGALAYDVHRSGLQADRSASGRPPPPTAKAPGVALESASKRPPVGANGTAHSALTSSRRVVAQ